MPNVDHQRAPPPSRNELLENLPSNLENPPTFFISRVWELRLRRRGLSKLRKEEAAASTDASSAV